MLRNSAYRRRRGGTTKAEDRAEVSEGDGDDDDDVDERSRLKRRGKERDVVDDVDTSDVKVSWISERRESRTSVPRGGVDVDTDRDGGRDVRGSWMGRR